MWSFLAEQFRQEMLHLSKAGQNNVATSHFPLTRLHLPSFAAWRCLTSSRCLINPPLCSELIPWCDKREVDYKTGNSTQGKCNLINQTVLGNRFYLILDSDGPGRAEVLILLPVPGQCHCSLCRQMGSPLCLSPQGSEPRARWGASRLVLTQTVLSPNWL